ncbi:MAG: glycosyltransferase family 4 protein [Parcubacteria group bacterium]
MKKTLLITSNFYPEEGGIGSFMRIYFYLPRESLVILAPRKGDFKEFDRQSLLKTIRSRWVGSSEGLGRLVRPVALTFEVLLLLARFGFQAIHVADIKSIPPPLWVVLGFTRIPVLSFVHGQELAIAGKSKVRTALKNSKVLISNSRFTRDVLIKEFNVPPEKIEIINPGVNPDLFKAKVDLGEVKKQYDLKDKFVILTVSRLIKRKGHDTVLKSLVRLKQQGFKEFFYLIIGRGPNENRIRARVRELGLNENVAFVGYVDNKSLPDFYRACDVFVMVPDMIGGDYEGFGIVYLEAGAFGKPVIGSRSGGIPDAVYDGKTGFLIGSGDASALTNILTSLIKDRRLGVKMGKAGSDRVKDFTFEKVAGRFRSILDERAL